MSNEDNGLAIGIDRLRYRARGWLIAHAGLSRKTEYQVYLVEINLSVIYESRNPQTIIHIPQQTVSIY